MWSTGIAWPFGCEAPCVSAGSALPQPINSDPYTNPSSQHKTQPEPDSFSFGNTIVAVAQTGRFTNGGASNIAWATSLNAGRTWTTGMLPGTTVYQGGPWDRISDPSVAYDPMHNVWLAAGLVLQGTRGAGVVVNRSTNGGTTWLNPVNRSRRRRTADVPRICARLPRDVPYSG